MTGFWPCLKPMAERAHCPDRSDVVTCARRWIGTPYLHQGARRGVGCDCLGLVRGIWRELFGSEPMPVPAYSPDWREAERDEALWLALAQVCREAREGDLMPGQILLFRMRAGSVAKHLGVLSLAGPAPRFIHAYSGHGVVENALSPPWERRIVARFEFI